MISEETNDTLRKYKGVYFYTENTLTRVVKWLRKCSRSIWKVPEICDKRKQVGRIFENNFAYCWFVMLEHMRRIAFHQT